MIKNVKIITFDVCIEIFDMFIEIVGVFIETPGVFIETSDVSIETPGVYTISLYEVSLFWRRLKELGESYNMRFWLSHCAL